MRSYYKQIKMERGGIKMLGRQNNERNIDRAQNNQYNSTSIIKETVDRSYVWQALTPQIFSREALTKASNLYKDSENYTDESSLVESFGGKVGIVEGSSNNIKITTKEDFTLAEAILLLQNNLISRDQALNYAINPTEMAQKLNIPNI